VLFHFNIFSLCSYTKKKIFIDFVEIEIKKSSKAYYHGRYYEKGVNISFSRNMTFYSPRTILPFWIVFTLTISSWLLAKSLMLQVYVKLVCLCMQLGSFFLLKSVLNAPCLFSSEFGDKFAICFIKLVDYLIHVL